MSKYKWYKKRSLRAYIHNPVNIATNINSILEEHMIPELCVQQDFLRVRLNNNLIYENFAPYSMGYTHHSGVQINAMAGDFLNINGYSIRLNYTAHYVIDINYNYVRIMIYVRSDQFERENTSSLWEETISLQRQRHAVA